MTSAYARAGVDLVAADAAVDAIRPHAERTRRPEVLDSIGGFGGLFALDLTRWREPVLVSATDGVGTKLELAREAGRHRGVGVDLVAMVVDDLVVPGAEPLFFLDYCAVGALDPAQLGEIVAGIADGCVAAGCALIGGETAEHPGVMAPGSYDLAGFGVGIVERADVLGPARVRAGDALVAMAASGLHSNGYSLVRKLLAGRSLDDDHGLGAPLRDVLLEPTRIYAKDCLALAAAAEVHAFCHVTGGGLPGNLPRVLPDGLGVEVDRGSWDVPAIFRLLQHWGDVPEGELWDVFNMGVGMVAVVADGPAAVDVLAARSVPAWVCGAVVEGTGVRLR